MKGKIYAALMALPVLTACSHNESITLTDFKVNEETSAVEWKGSAPTHFHVGAFKISGKVETDGKGKILGGDFTIPIASISDFDLTDAAEREALLNHLKSPDFFNVAVHPYADFHITKVEPYSDTGSNANMLITGDFKMIGQTYSIQIPAVVKAEKDKMSAEGSFKLNRQKWGMNSYTDPDADLYILPDVDIKLKLYFTSSGT